MACEADWVAFYGSAAIGGGLDAVTAEIPGVDVAVFATSVVAFMAAFAALIQCLEDAGGHDEEVASLKAKQAAVQAELDKLKSHTN
jgi:hypothetical protein